MQNQPAKELYGHASFKEMSPEGRTCTVYIRSFGRERLVQRWHCPGPKITAEVD